MNNFNLTAFFNKEAQTLIKSYKRLLSIRRGIRQDNAPSNKKSTIRKKGKDHWLQDTKETTKKGFEYNAKPKSMIVYASKASHSGRSSYKGNVKYRNKNPLSYEEIFAKHNQKGYSGIFGDELPANSKFPDRLSKELVRQAQNILKDKLPKKVKLKVKM